MSNKFDEKIKLIRNYLGLSQAKFSELSDIPLGSYKNYENGTREISASALHKISNLPECKKFALWLMTDMTNSEMGQLAPNESIENKPSLQLIDHDEYQSQFIEQVQETLMMFGYLDWLLINTDKCDFEACGKLMLKELQPIINTRYSIQEKKQTQSNLIIKNRQLAVFFIIQQGLILVVFSS
jgi:transcriptional regulator with XRE-family HTH domain